MFSNSDVFMYCIKKFSNIVFATVLASNLLVASGKTAPKKMSPIQRLFRSCFPTRSHSSESKNVFAPSPSKRQLSQSLDKSPSRQVPIQSESDTGDVDVWHEYLNPFADFDVITSLDFKEGDILFTEHTRSTLVAISKTQLAHVLAGKRCWSWTAITTRYKKGSLVTARFVDIPDTESWSRKQRAALMRKLMNKKLPYRYYRCNEEHYLAYILHGTTHKSSYSKCPLGRDLSKIPAKDIENEGFELQNKPGKPVVPETAVFYQYSDQYNRRTPVKRKTSQAREGP